MIYKEFAVLLFIIIFSLLYYGLKKLKPIHLFVLDSLFIQLIIIGLLDFYGLLK